MPYTRKGVIYEGPTLKRGRKFKKTVIVSAPTTVNNSVKSYVKRAINNAGETKLALREVFKQIAIPGTGLDSASGLGLFTTAGCLPSIVRGDGPADRDGDSIRVKDFIVKWTLRGKDITSAAGTNPNKTPMWVRVIVYNHRFALDEANPNNIIDKGNTSGNLDSSPDSWLEPYDKKEFIIHYSKTYKMAPLMNYSVGTGVSATVENMPNGFNHFIQGSKRIKIPAKLLYNGTASQPTNCMPMVAFCVVNVDGLATPATQFRIDVNCETKLTYFD